MDKAYVDFEALFRMHNAGAFLSGDLHYLIVAYAKHALKSTLSICFARNAGKLRIAVFILNLESWLNGLFKTHLTMR
jgi:hypothetical protein